MEAHEIKTELEVSANLNYQLVRDNAYLMHVIRELRVGHAKQKEHWMEPSNSEYELRARIESYRSYLVKRKEIEKAEAIAKTDILELPLLPTGTR